MRDGARLRHGLVEKVHAFGNQRIIRQRLAQHRQGHLRAHQILTQTIVKFAGKFPALLVLQLQQAHAQSAQRRLGLLSRFQLRVEHTIMQEQQHQRNKKAAPSM